MGMRGRCPGVVPAACHGCFTGRDRAPQPCSCHAATFANPTRPLLRACGQVHLCLLLQRTCLAQHRNCVLCGASKRLEAAPCTAEFALRHAVQSPELRADTDAGASCQFRSVIECIRHGATAGAAARAAGCCQHSTWPLERRPGAQLLRPWHQHEHGWPFQPRPRRTGTHPRGQGVCCVPRSQQH